MNKLGWVQIHRCIRDNGDWYSGVFTAGQAWVDLVLLACQKNETITFNGKMIEVKRGQLLRSQVRLAEMWKWNRMAVKRQFDKWCDLNQLEYDIIGYGKRSATLITILNYEEYQNWETPKDVSIGVGEKKLQNPPPRKLSLHQHEIAVLNAQLRDVNGFTKGDPGFCAKLKKDYGFIRTYEALSELGARNVIFNEPGRARGYIIAMLKNYGNGNSAPPFPADNEGNEVTPNVDDVYKERYN